MKLLLCIISTILLTLGFKGLAQHIDPLINSISIETIDEPSNSNHEGSNGWTQAK